MRLSPVVALFLEGELGRCRGTAPEMVPTPCWYSSLELTPGSMHLRNPRLQVQEPHKENRSPDLGFSLPRQLWKPTLHAFCVPELLPGKKEQVANWFNPLGEHYCSLWITAEHPCDREPLQVFFSHILLLQLWEKQFSSTLLLLKAMSTRCTPAL